VSFQNAKIISVGTDDGAYHLNKKEFKRGSPEFLVSPSMLKEFDKCASRWLSGYNPPDSDAKDYGSLFDCLVLNQSAFWDRYILRPETYTNEDGEEKKWNGNAKVCREWIARAGTKEIISNDQWGEVKRAKERFFQDETISMMIGSGPSQVLVRGEWKHEETGLIIPVECLLDKVPEKDSDFANCLPDVKSSRNASSHAWNSWCFQAAYHVQAAFDIDLYNTATGEQRDTWLFLISENYSPFEPSKKILSQEFLEIGRGEVHRILSNYAVCLKTNHWPGYDEERDSKGRVLRQGWGICEPPPWAKNADGQRFTYVEDEEEADAMPEEFSHPN